MTDKTIPEICADLMLKRELAEVKPLWKNLRWARYSSACAEAVPLLVEEIKRLEALLAKVRHYDCESIWCRHCCFRVEVHGEEKKCRGGKTAFAPKDCTCYLSEKETT